ncbi:GA1981-PA-like protein [Naegleria gruberi]|uniref:GA1981-PA-like protein n=1 Tax=Naegleria gruberi TaxID=5762 RepID=D2VSZ7_NAEGR|nr:GA1981-PA-like protein [Naegleria gruberi]EFC40064.1 GA1981-PA-like protein [Naegleria gruberi]|eukprot:XP_002672808.1 GA1981-PA-like protein [Naegleria gruberi strain NEG-M]
MKRFNFYNSSPSILIIVLCCVLFINVVFGSDQQQQQINADPIVDIHIPTTTTTTLADQYKSKIYSDQSLRDDIMKRFQDYLRLPTQHPKPDYATAIDFLLKWTRSVFHIDDSTDPIKEVQVNANLKTGENSILKYYIFHCNPAKPSFIFTWKGRDASKGSIMINSHTDVVPVDKDQWKYPPFDATMVDENTGKGRRVYSRGSQDMKNIGTGYMEALVALVESGFKPERNLQVVFIADEEIGGDDGWECLIQNELWKELNVSFGIDEGLASGLDEDIIPIYYGENVAHWFEITATGNVGHGSQFIPQTATEKIYKLLNEKVFPFREQQQVQMRLQTNNPREKTQCSTVITINLTGLRAGHTNKETGEFSSPNVIPRTATALFDMRIPPHIDLKEIEIMLRSWADFVNGTIKFIEQPKINPVADLNDETVKKFLDIVSSRMKTELRIFPAATDARFPRAAGVNMIGYSYMPNTKVLLHDHNEYLDENVYLDSIVHYIAILEGLLQN